MMNNFCKVKINAPERSEIDSAYEVKDAKGGTVGIDILILFYGNLWQRALDRIEHQVDGYIHAIQRGDEQFRIYRKLNIEEGEQYPKLSLVT